MGVRKLAKKVKMNKGGGARRQVYDRGLLLHGPKRNEVLTLGEVQQYGIDSFADPDYISLYGMTPTEWYARGIRLLRQCEQS